MSDKPHPLPEGHPHLRATPIRDVVSCYCTLVDESEHSISVKIESWASTRAGDETEKVTEGVFAYVAVDENGKPREVRNDASAKD